MKYNKRPQHIFPRKSYSAKQYYKDHLYKAKKNNNLLDTVFLCVFLMVVVIIFYLLIP